MSQHFRFLSLLTALLIVVASAGNANAKEGSGQKAGSASKQGSATKATSGPKDYSVLLFNGQNLDNWIKQGGDATYKIEGDTIVGTSALNTPNTFLCTKREYADFVLELELKVDDGLNSGIQIRSQCNDHAIQFEGKDMEGNAVSKKIDAGRVHGYQVEIDPSDRAFSGGIYDEARRGWLQKPSGEEHKATREAFKRGEWNKYRIEVVGNSIKTWINGVPISNLTDDMDAAGLIALQVHGVGDKKELVGKQVRWRNLLLKEINAAK